MKKMSFIGGGRVTRILLKGFKRAGISLENVLVSDTNPDVLKRIIDEFPEVTVQVDANVQAIQSDIIFLAVHPPVIAGALGELSVQSDSIIVSLAPKFTVSKISELTNGASKIVRMIPNAPSVIGKGFNPVCFSAGISEDERKVLCELFGALGEYEEVPEQNLEAYAILTAMGPTYFWYQLYELQSIVTEYGLTDEEAKEGIEKMVSGAVATMYESGYTPAEVMDLVPVKPMVDQEGSIKEAYKKNLDAVHQKIKP